MSKNLHSLPADTLIASSIPPESERRYQQLCAMRDDLRQRLPQELGALASSDDMRAGGDVVDMALGATNEPLHIGEVELVEQQLCNVDVAIARIQDGTHNQCEDCGLPISKARLNAVPSATRCVKCQRESEK
ncbi:MAG: TraR/DksA family transcriptional regulator [Candidatus Peribacteraceae bacterium]|jgi:DnaK suppressor protein